MNVAKLKGTLVTAGKNVEWLAGEVNIDRSSMYRKLEKFDKITIGEAIRIKNALNISNEDAIDIFLS